MEERMTDETTDYGYGPAGDGGGEPAPEPAEPQSATPPPLNDAVAQMRQIDERLARIEQAQQEQPAPQPAYDPDYDQGYAPDFDPDDPHALAGAMQQLVDARVGEYEAQHRDAANRAEILSFADEHPRLHEPEVANAVATRLERLGLDILDAEAWKTGYYAYEAERAALGQESQEQPTEQQPQPSVTLERGAGTRPAEAPEMDPTEAAYMGALTSRHKPNKYGL
jgi:hypothetical protein